MPALATEPQSATSRDVKKCYFFRCYAWSSSPGEFIAECVDLDVMVRGSSPHEAFDKLKDAILGYVRVVSAGDEKGLLPRPSPLLHRLRYHWFCFKAALTSERRNFQLFDCIAPC